MTKYDGIVVGDVLRDIRKNNKLTQREMAEKLDVSHIHYSKIEQGERRLHIDLMIEIVNMFDVDVNFFFGKKKNFSNPEIQLMLSDLMKLDCYGKAYVVGVWRSILKGYMDILQGGCL